MPFVGVTATGSSIEGGGGEGECERVRKGDLYCNSSERRRSTLDVKKKEEVKIAQEERLRAHCLVRPRARRIRRIRGEGK